MTKRCVKYFNGAQKKAGKVAVKGDSFVLGRIEIQREHFHSYLIIIIILFITSQLLFLNMEQWDYTKIPASR